MRRLLLAIAVLLVACTPAPRKDAMSSPIPAPQDIVPSATAGTMPADTPAAALGRRTLSTAFVRIGPDGHLTVELHGGRVLVLRDVTMGRKDYCGKLASGKRFCGGYAEVAAARPGDVTR